ncbi:putative transcriptional regulator YvhJ [Streptomyces sp. ADI96-15]|uniref:LCP family protein n=1 Tax=Streptomyces sp. ADI96-15 TaxID=1522761 RepID=UPI000FA2BBDC|nr:LCP family protein [Streptomyces sp. ADI96-15]RPK58285.1 putative transcriptional regulator YvhJ [Streptomyces sp. ADI96-15]
MTDRAGRPDGQGDEGNQETEESGVKEQGARWGPRPARQGPGRRPFLRRRWVRWTAAGTTVALIGAGFGAWALYDRLQGNITRDDAVIAELERHEKERPLPSKQGARNILLVGSDTRAGQGNGQYGAARGQRSDTVILLHLAADRRSATAMSIPRDLMVEIPSCRRADGQSAPARTAQFNYAYSYGGTACTIRTVERLTRIRVDHHMVVDFQGFKRMVDAVDGVRICLKQPMDDKDAHVRLPAGEHTLNGEQSLGFVRARKSLGNGSDTDRMERQQQFLGALVAKVQSNGVLLNPGKLYPLLDAATSSLTTDPSIASLIDLYDLVRSMRNIPTKEVRFLTVPREAYAGDPNRDQLVEPAASELFTLLREDEPVRITPRPSDSASPAPSASPTGTGPAAPSAPSAPSGTPGVRSTPVPDPTFSGNSAARSACE